MASQSSFFSGKRIVQAFGHSMAGLRAAVRAEVALQQELVLAIITIPLALCSPVSAVAKALMIMVVLLVIILELVNTAIENIVDRISSERHPLSKQAKDVGSAIVLVAMINVVVVWLVILV